MIRLILKQTFSDTISGAHGTAYETLVMDHPELEERLTSGGYGESGHCRMELIGAEVFSNPQKNRQPGPLEWGFVEND